MIHLKEVKTQGQIQIKMLCGKDGKTPVKGVDYFTEEDKQEMINNTRLVIVREIEPQINELQEEVGQLDRDITNVDNRVTSLNEELQEQEQNINHLEDKKADRTEIPDVSQFITKTVDNLVNYYKKTETYTQTEINQLIGQIKTVSMKLVPELPTIGETNIIYLVPSSKAEEKNIYDEFIYVNNKWERIGSTQTDLSNVYTKEEINTILFDYITSNDLEEKLAEYIKTTDIATTSKLGIIKAQLSNYGFGVSTSGIPYANAFNKTNYDNIHNNAFIGKKTLENIKKYLVKEGLVDNDIVLTDEEKLKIETWLGLSENYLTTYNTTPYQVTDTYNPAHKKYVDDNIEVLDSRIDELELFKFPNMTIVGTPTIQNGQVSNFTLDDYLEFPFLVDFRNRPFEINFAFTTGNNVTVQQNILDSAFGLALAIKNGKTLMAISYNGTTWANQYTGTLNIEPNTTYVYKIIWNGMLYKVQYYNGSEYVNDFYFTSTQQPYPKQMFIGVSKLSNNYFEGSINLNYANLKVDNNVVWTGMDDAGLASRLATDLSNVDEAGIQKIKDIAKEYVDTLDGNEVAY